jgi:ankyrin repeat protein
MTVRSLDTMYRLAKSGETEALFAHIEELLALSPGDTDLLHLALTAASEANQIDTARALIERGANVEGASERLHIHPLWKAAKCGHLSMIKLLLEYGANPDTTDNRGYRAIDYARRYGRQDVVAYLESLDVSARSSRRPAIGRKR